MTERTAISRNMLTNSEVMNMVENNRGNLMKDLCYYNKRYGQKFSDVEIEDVAGTVIYKTLLASGSFDPSRASMRTFMSRIARNEMVNALKEKTVFSSLFVDCQEGREDEYGSYELYINIEEEMKNDRLMRAIDSLSDRDKSVMLMLAKGCSGREMAKRLNISESAQRKLVSDMRIRLRKRLVAMHYYEEACESQIPHTKRSQVVCN